MSEPILDVTTNKTFVPEPMVQRATDPVLQPTTYSTPGD